MSKAIKQVLKSAATVQRGPRNADGISGSEDALDKELYKHLQDCCYCSSCSCLVLCVMLQLNSHCCAWQKITLVACADGGTSEQSALSAESIANCLPNLRYVVNDRAHRMRSIQRGSWTYLNDLCGDLLEHLIRGEGSLARELENSGKYRILWKKCQGQHEEFSGAIRNFSFALQRFNSLSEPLFKLLVCLKSVYAFLAKLCEEGDREDRLWAEELIGRLTGADAYQHLVNTALVADAMLVGQKFLRLADVSDDTACVTAAQAG